MVFKPNYNHERSERERAKQRKKQEKAQRRQGDEPQPEPGLSDPNFPASSPPDALEPEVKV